MAKRAAKKKAKKKGAWRKTPGLLHELRLAGHLTGGKRKPATLTGRAVAGPHWKPKKPDWRHPRTGTPKSHIPLDKLEKRLVRLGKIVAERQKHRSVWA